MHIRCARASSILPAPPPVRSSSGRRSLSSHLIDLDAEVRLFISGFLLSLTSAGPETQRQSGALRLSLSGAQLRGVPQRWGAVPGPGLCALPSHLALERTWSPPSPGSFPVSLAQGGEAGAGGPLAQSPERPGSPGTNFLRELDGSELPKRIQMCLAAGTAAHVLAHAAWFGSLAEAAAKSGNEVNERVVLGHFPLISTQLQSDRGSDLRPRTFQRHPPQPGFKGTGREIAVFGCDLDRGSVPEGAWDTGPEQLRQLDSSGHQSVET